MAVDGRSDTGGSRLAVVRSKKRPPAVSQSHMNSLRIMGSCNLIAPRLDAFRQS